MLGSKISVLPTFYGRADISLIYGWLTDANIVIGVKKCYKMIFQSGVFLSAKSLWKRFWFREFIPLFLQKGFREGVEDFFRLVKRCYWLAKVPHYGRQSGALRELKWRFKDDAPMLLPFSPCTQVSTPRLSIWRTALSSLHTNPWRKTWQRADCWFFREFWAMGDANIVIRQRATTYPYKLSATMRGTTKKPSQRAVFNYKLVILQM